MLRDDLLRVGTPEEAMFGEGDKEVFIDTLARFRGDTDRLFAYLFIARTRKVDVYFLSEDIEIRAGVERVDTHLSLILYSTLYANPHIVGVAAKNLDKLREV